MYQPHVLRIFINSLDSIVWIFWSISVHIFFSSMLVTLGETLIYFNVFYTHHHVTEKAMEIFTSFRTQNTLA